MPVMTCGVLLVDGLIGSDLERFQGRSFFEKTGEEGLRDSFRFA
jgi:hypothetical protein